MASKKAKLPMKLPIIIINFKAYEESTGVEAIELGKICEKVSDQYGIDIAVAPSYVDIYHLSENVNIPIFAQHIDPVDVGKHTGHITAASVKKDGASGVFINHSERKLELGEVKKCVGFAYKYGLTSLCFASTPEEAGEIAIFGPDFIAIEPPELIGTGISVSVTKPDIITEAIDVIKGVNPDIVVLCGAGITNGEDVKKAMELGTKGVVVASGVVKSRDPKKVLEVLAEAISP